MRTTLAISMMCAGLLAGCATAVAEPPAAQQLAQSDAAALAQLQDMRASIDNIDAAILRLMAERFKVTEAVGELKAEHTLPPKDPAREAAQIERKRALAQEAGLDPDFAEALHHFVVAQVIKRHTELQDEE